MEHDWIKATFILTVAAKDRDATDVMRRFHGRLPSSQGGTTPKFKYFGNFFIWIDKGHVVINLVKIIWIFYVTFSGNVDMTGKQHPKHQWFWRFPFSPMEASSRLPRSCDYLFLHSMSKASLPRGPDMWYLTFYENKVPIYQTTISNSL